MNVRHRAEGLHACDHPRHRLTLAERGLHVGAQGARGHAAQQPQPAPVLEEVRPQALGERQHHLPVRHRSERVLVEPQAPLGQPPGVARGAEMAPLAPERYQELGPARAAAHPGEAVLEQPTVEEPAGRLARRRTQRTVRDSGETI